MKIKKIICTLYFIIIGINTCLLSQTKPLFYTTESPNASALRANIETPVSLASGKVGAHLPIYEVKDKDLSFPLRLSYNSSGIKPDLHPGWVGQGWSLSQAVITRVVNGAPDELYWRDDNVITLSGDNTWSNTIPTGFAFHNNINTSYSWNSTTRITELAKNGSEPGTFWKDAEPDEFIFTCGDLSGSFFFGPNGKVLVQGRSDINVEAEIVYNIPWGFDPTRPLNPNDQYSFTSVYTQPSYYIFTRSRIARILGFRITGPDGKIYDFGQFGKSYSSYNTFDEMEFTANVHDQFYASEVFTSWYMTKMTSPLSGAKIEFTYERGSPIMTLGRGFSFYKMAGSAPARGFMGWLFGGVSSSVSQAQEEVDGKFIRPTYLKKIITSDTEIEFTTSVSKELRYNELYLLRSLVRRADNYNPNLIVPTLYSRMMIGSIVGYIANPYLRPSMSYFEYLGSEEYLIFRKDGYIEQIDFSRLSWEQLDRIKIRKRGNSAYYRDLNFKYSTNYGQRLQLNSLLDSDIGTPYIFNYYSSSILPGYLSMRIDHWGYFNNKFVQIDINNTSSLTNYKNLRNSDPSQPYAGMLTRITFPTQGYKEFIYESNTYTSYVARNSTTGAFSISAPTWQAVPAAGLRIKGIREVAGNGMPEVYTNYTYGDGLLNADIQYYWPGYTGKLLNGNTYSSDRFVTESMLPMIRHSAGGEIAYSHVIESKTGLGRTEYDFVSFSDNPDVHGNSIDPQKSIYSPFTSRVFARGQLKEKRVYEQGRTLPILKETNTYRYNPGLFGRSFRAVRSRGLRLFGTYEVNAIEGTSYEHFDYPYQLWTKRTQELDKANNSYVTLLEEYEYDNASYRNDNQLKRYTKRNPLTGEAIIVEYKHTLDFTTGGLGSNYPEAAGLTGLFNANVVDREISKSISRTASFSSTPKYISAVVDLYHMQGSTPRLYKNYALELSSPINSFTQSFTPSSFQLDTKFSERYHFNKYDRYGNVIQLTLNKQQPESYIWGSKGEYLMAAFTNAKSNEVALLSGERFGELGGWNNFANASPIFMQSPVSKSVLSIGAIGPGKHGLSPIKKYVLTYWVKGSTPLSVSGGETNSFEIMASQNGWTTFLHILTNAISISVTGGDGAAKYVDDLLLYPYDSNVKVYNYNDWGAIINETDHTGEITFYEYDDKRRLRLVRDRQGNVLNHYEYNYSQINTTRYYNYAKTGQFVVNNCSNTSLIGDEITYTIPSGKHVSLLSQYDADLMAINDLNTNGQAYANEVGSCKAEVTFNKIGEGAGVLKLKNNLGESFLIRFVGEHYSIKVPPGTYNLSCMGVFTNSLLFDIDGQIQQVVERGTEGEVLLGWFNIDKDFYIKVLDRFYGNTVQTRQFVKNDCLLGQEGSNVIYQISANKFFSIISQSDANKKAIDHIISHGQDYANQFGTCKSTVKVSLIKTSNLLNFNPVTINFVPTGGSSGTFCVFPPINSGNFHFFLPTGKYTLTISIPYHIPFTTKININGALVYELNDVLSGEFQYDFLEGIEYVITSEIGLF